jgi:hypothetical protein
MLGIIALVVVAGFLAYVALQLVLLVMIMRAMAKVALPIILGPIGFVVRTKPEPFRMLGSCAWAKAIELRCHR